MFNFKKNPGLFLFALSCICLLYLSITVVKFDLKNNYKPIALNKATYFYIPEDFNKIKTFDKLEQISNFKELNTFPQKTNKNLISLKVLLPKVNLSNAYVFIETYDQNVQVFINRKEIYRNYTNNISDRTFDGIKFHQIKLPEDFQGKTLYINLFSRFSFNNFYSKSFLNLTFNEGNGMFLYQTYNHFPEIALGVLLIYFSAFMLLTIIIKKVNFAYFRSLAILALYTAIVDLIIVYPYRDWIVNWGLFWYYCSFAIFVIFYFGIKFIVVLLTQLNVYKDTNILKYKKAYGIIGIILLVVAFLCDIFGLISFYTYYIYLIIFIYLFFITAIVEIVYKLGKHISKIKYAFLAGILVILSGIIDTANKFTIYTLENNFLIAWSLIILTFVLTMHFMKEYKKNINYDILISKESEEKNLLLLEGNVKFQEASNELIYLNQSLEHLIEDKTKELLYKNEELTRLHEELDLINKDMEFAYKSLQFKNQSLTEISKEKDIANKELNNTLENLKILQDQLVQSEKFSSLGALISGISHEINTPLGVSITACSYIEQNLKGILNKYVNGMMKKTELVEHLNLNMESIQIIIANLDNATNIITSFKKVSLGQTSDKMETINLKEYINHLLVSLNPRFKKERHKITVDCSEHINIKSYPGFFMQILTNLVVNSLIHAYDDGQIGEILIKVNENDGIIIEYSDNGKGIHENILPHIFEQYYTTGNSNESTGLGLSIIKGLVETKLNGTIQCISEFGKGAKFIIKFNPEKVLI